VFLAENRLPSGRLLLLPQSEPPQPPRQRQRDVRVLKPVDPAPFLCGSTSIAPIDVIPACPPENPHRGSKGHAFNAPHRFALGLFRPLHVRAPKSSLPCGQTRPAPATSTGRRSVHFGTLLGATGGDPNTLAPNRGKA